MAEMLVDGAKLDACNTAEADAIRAKAGGTDPIPYDYANNKGFADAIASIPSGGGGAQVYTGTIVLSNQDVDVLTIPVDTSMSDYVDVNVIATKTGTVNDGEVTYHSNPFVPGGVWNIILGYWACTASTRTITVDYLMGGQTYTRTYNVTDQNCRYLAGRDNLYPSTVGIALSSANLKRNGILLSTQNINRKFCGTGFYIEFDYIVKAY